jgi:hypothetical protein
MSQDFVFTALPAQKTEVDGVPHLKLSVFVSVKLKTSKETTLNNYQDILEWPEKVLGGEFSFKLGDGSESEAVLVRDNVDAALYHSLFRPEIRIKPFDGEDPGMKKIISFPVTHIKDFIFKNYRQTAIESPSKLVSADKFIDLERFAPMTSFTLDQDMIMQAGNLGRQTGNVPRMTKASDTRQVLKKDFTLSRQLNMNLVQEKFVKFSPVMQPRTDFSQFRNFHKLENENVRTIRDKLKKPEFDFHDILSVLTNYPQMMRKCGFILDFLIPAAGIPSSGNIRLIPSSLDLSDDETHISVPSTAYNLSSTGFYPADKPGSSFRQGFVKINTPAFSVIQVDTDGTAIKTHNMTETKVQEVARFYEQKINFAQLNAGKNQVAQEPEPPEDEGLPFIRSAGIAITKNGMAEHLFTKINANLKLIPDLKTLSVAIPAKSMKQTGNPGDKKLRNLIVSELDIKKTAIKELLLYSDDLVQGYRMDIAYEDNPGRWYSLHQRLDHYQWFDEQNNPHDVANTVPDEGFIELAAAEDPDSPGDLYIPETLARWEGWSLALHLPGYSINNTDDDPSPVKRDLVYNTRIKEQKKYAFDPSLDFKLNVQSEIVPGTLPRLRFGREYRVRIRTVDLAGNSIPLTAPTESPSDSERKNIRYMRYEPLASPIVLVGNELRDGEFLENLVIRSNFDRTCKQYENHFQVNSQDFGEYSQRFLLPPKNSPAMAEHHGMIEKAFGNHPESAKTIYEMITSHEGSFERPDKTKEKVYQPSDVEIIYLPDPMAAGVAFFLSDGYEADYSQEFTPRMFGFFTGQELSPDNTNGQIPEDWYKALPLRIRLEEGEPDSRWDSSSRILRINLPKAFRMKIRFSTFWREQDFKKLSAIWEMITDGHPANMAEIEKLARSGQHWMLSPTREFELVHAVQQPVEVPVIKALIPEREFDQTSAEINLRFTVHGKSTEKIELQARWTDPVDDGISVTIKEKAGRNNIPDIKIHYHDETITLGTVIDFVKVAPHLQMRGPLKVQAIPVYTPQKRTIAEFNKEPQPGTVRLNHVYARQTENRIKVNAEWNSSRKLLADRVKFDIADARFKFIHLINLRYDPLVQNFGDTKHHWVDYQLTGTSRYRDYFDKILKVYPEETTHRESLWFEKVNILSTVRPKLPDIDYVIPTFEWRKTQTAGAVRHRRMGGGLRVWLKRPWYSTGADEMLAVILPPKTTQAGINAMMLSRPGYTDLYTHWAMDPIVASVPPENVSPKPEDFRINPLPDQNLQYPGPGSTRADIVAYPVHFDEDQQQWYCDLAIDPQQMYFPFIRLALARYQPYSVKKAETDVCLSPVVFSTFIQLVPERQTTLRFNKDDVNSRFSLTIEGVIYNERMMIKYGNTNFIRISFIDSQIAQPIFGLIDDGNNVKELAEEGLEFPITMASVTNNRFSITKEIRLPRKYKTGPFQVVIEEFERGPAKIPDLDQFYSDRVGQSEETDRLIYADVIKINEIKK